MHLTFFGTRGSCPCSGDDYALYGGSTSCILLETQSDEPIILDAGTGLRALGAWLRPHYSNDRPLRARLLLTHLHFDHLLGLPFFSPLEDAGSVLEIFGPTQGECSLAETIDAAVTPPFFPVQVKEFGGEIQLVEVGSEDFAAGDVKVTARWIPHTGPTLGFRIEAEGVTLAYLPDHQAPPDRSTITDSVLELCHDVDLLIHDGQYTEDEFASKPDWGHSTVAYAVHVAAQAHAKNLILFHHDPAHTDDTVRALELEAQSLPGSEAIDSIISAREGMSIDVGQR